MGLKVITAPTVEPITLTEAKAHCRVDITDDNDLITRLITAVREQAELLTERALAPTTFGLYLDAFPSEGIALPRPPYTSLTSIQYVDDDGATQTLASDQYAVDDKQEPSWVLPAYNVDWPDTRDEANAVRITYQAGYIAADCPAPIKAWMLAAIAATYGQRELIAQSDRVPSMVRFLDGLLDRYRVMSY